MDPRDTAGAGPPVANHAAPRHMDRASPRWRVGPAHGRLRLALGVLDRFSRDRRRTGMGRARPRHQSCTDGCHPRVGTCPGPLRLERPRASSQATPRGTGSRPQRRSAPPARGSWAGGSRHGSRMPPWVCASVGSRPLRCPSRSTAQPRSCSVRWSGAASGSARTRRQEWSEDALADRHEPVTEPPRELSTHEWPAPASLYLAHPVSYHSA